MQCMFHLMSVICYVFQLFCQHKTIDPFFFILISSLIIVVQYFCEETLFLLFCKSLNVYLISLPSRDTTILVKNMTTNY